MSTYCGNIGQLYTKFIIRFRHQTTFSVKNTFFFFFFLFVQATQKQTDRLQRMQGLGLYFEVLQISFTFTSEVRMVPNLRSLSQHPKSTKKSHTKHFLTLIISLDFLLVFGPYVILLLNVTGGNGKKKLLSLAFTVSPQCNKSCVCAGGCGTGAFSSLLKKLLHKSLTYQENTFNTRAQGILQ